MSALCDPIDGSPPGSPVPGILQARTLEWVAISFSNAWKWKVKVKSLSRVPLLATPWTAAHQAPQSVGFSRQEYWSGAPLPSPFGWLHNIEQSSLCYAADPCWLSVFAVAAVWLYSRSVLGSGFSHSVVSNSLQPHRLLGAGNFPGKNTGAGCHFLLQGTFLTQRSNRISWASCLGW